MEDDKTMKIEEALQHSLWSRNVEIGRLGETPFKIMFGRTPVYPGITEGNLITDNSIESLVRLAYLVLLYFASIDFHLQNLGMQWRPCFFWGIQRGSGNFFASKVTEA